MKSSSTFLNDHKLRQKIYLAMNPNEVHVGNKKIIVKDVTQRELTKDLIDYFTIELEDLIYPAKSYAVAIIYGILLNKYFNLDLYTALRDEELFLGTDQYFVPYSRSPKAYDETLAYLKQNNLWDIESIDLSQVKTTIWFFHQEFYTAHENVADIKF